MKTRFCRILSVVMAFCLLLSAMPFPTMAEENGTVPSNEVTNGSYVDGVWTEGGSGSITYNVEGTDVMLSKTATLVDGMENTFDITLQVQTSTTTTIHTASGAVVLVFDVSGSMNYCAECGNEARHDGDCPLNDPFEDWFGHTQNSYVLPSETRIAAARSAGASFLSAYAGTDASAARQVSIVTFSTGYSVRMDWANVAGGSGNNSYDAVLNSIWGLSANGGTNLEGGLYTALSQLSDMTGYDSTSVVVLTDGVPTYRMNGGNGSEGSAANNFAAANRAVAIKNTGAILYSICFGVANESTYWGGPTVGDFLRDSVASPGYAYNANNSAELHAAFSAISENITESITNGMDGLGWTASDPMADMITVIGGVGENFSGSDGEYTWKLTDAEVTTSGNVTTYTYTYTYRITLDVQGQNFEEGQFFPTNGETYLNVDGQKYAFPVPGVAGVLPRTDISVTKQWNDNDDQDGLRTEAVTVQLKDDQGNAIGQPVVLNAENNWTYTWDGETYNLIEKSKGEYHVYVAEERNVPEGYAVTYTTDGSNFALVVVNTHEVEKKDITVSKVWDDKNNQDGIRPGSVTVNLLADGTVVGTAELTAANGWSYTFSGFDVYKSGVEIVYTVEETNVPEGYAASVDGFTVTNSHEIAKTSVEVTKVWNDNDNQDGIRPNYITVVLVADGQETEYTLTLNDANNWSGSFSELDKYADGQVIVYTVKEIAVEGYNTVITGDQTSGYTITNSHTPAVVAVSGSKTWNDNNDQDGARPESITIHLMKDGQVIDTVTATEADGWAWNFTNLPKYENQGTLITYAITEDAVEDYTTVVNGYNVINTYAPKKTSVMVTKAWVDNNDQDGIRPNDITVVLLANGEETEYTVVLNQGNNWSDTFTDLDKYENGEEIVYTVKEVEVTGYTSVISGNQVNGYIITNSHNPATMSVSGEKTWEDEDNQDGFRPESITINLLANGEIIDTIEVTEADGWAWTFENLPVYENHGSEIIYSVTENAVEDYSTEYDGYNVINTHTPEQTSVTVSKAWFDNNDQDGIRPDEITVILLANGEETDETLVLTADDNWTGSFTELDKYADGVEIVYTVSEIEVEGYETVITGDQITGYTITNSHLPEIVSVEGAKTWDDNNNQDGVRPDSITINLLRNGEVIDSVEVTEADDWSWSFINLPKYENGGVEIVYAITENAVEGYSTEYDGYNVTNSYTPAEISITVSKAWADDNDADGLRPDEITIILYANGEKTREKLELTAEGNWIGSFLGLPKYEGGVEIVYTIEEVSVKGYNTVIRGDAANGFVVTNSRTVIPPTGDERNPIIWVGAMIMSAAVVMYLSLESKKRRNVK